MHPRILLFLSLLFLTAATLPAQPGEFPWQVGRHAAAGAIQRLAAPGIPDGHVTVVFYDHSGQPLLHMMATAHRGEVLLAQAPALAPGVYMYRVQAPAGTHQGKVIVPRRA